MITKRLYVVDTGYLAELYRVDGHWEEASSGEVKRRVSEAAQRSDAFFVPVPVLFELGNHIAQMKTGGERRRRLAQKLKDDVVASCSNKEPWVITAFGSESVAIDFSEALVAYCAGFADEFAAAEVGLTDVAVIREALHLKARHNAEGSRVYKVHIWTRDHQVKAREPDAEEDAFI